MRSLGVVKVSPQTLAIVTMLAMATFAAGYNVARSGTPEDPSSEFSFRFESLETVFYELGWADGHLWMIDSNRDGILDEWTFWNKSGDQVFWLKDRNFDQRLDEWYKLTGEAEGALARDEDFDGTVDKVSRTVIVTKYKDALASK